jgi:Ca2+-binding RTX toxin-like protein
MRAEKGLRRWIGRASIMALLGGLLLPGAAMAVPPAVVTYGGGTGTVSAATGSEDEITVSVVQVSSITYFRVQAPQTRLVGGGVPCGPGPDLVVCNVGPGILRAIVNLGDKDDTLVTTGLPATVTSTLNGGRGDERITAGAGPDNITGGRGQDYVRSGAGNDTLNMRDGSRDVRIDCGDGNDTARVDRQDPRARNCERVRR